MTPPSKAERGRYLPLVKVGSGAYATVFVALDRRPFGVRQLVAMKTLHPHLAEEAAQREALVREARLLSAVRHPNVVGLLDVDLDAGVRLVLGYVEGVTLGMWLVELARRSERLDPRVVCRVGADALLGLHAIHEARSDLDRPLGLVHRDVSPQNLLVGTDGMSRLSDFGTAKVLFEPASETTDGALKGKLGYMAPEYIRGAKVDRRVDLFAVGVVLWEAFTGKRLFRGQNEGETLDRVLTAKIDPPSSIDPALRPFDAVLAKALARSPDERFATALELGQALARAGEEAGGMAEHDEVGKAVLEVFGEEIEARRAAVARAITEADAERSEVSNDTTEVIPDSRTSVALERGAEARLRTSSSTLRWAIMAGAVLVLAVAATLVAIRADESARHRSEASSASVASDERGRAAVSAGQAASAAPLGSAHVEPGSFASASAAPGSAEPVRSAHGTPRRQKPPPNPY